MTIKESIERIIKDNMRMQVVVGKVKSVDEDEMVCDIDLETSPDLLDVRLRAVIDKSDTGVLVYPKKDSRVLVGLIENKPQSAFICGYSEVEKIRLITEDIELAGDQFGGLIKIDDLVTKINGIEDALNDLAMDFDTHTHNSPPAPTNPVVTTPPIIPSGVVLVNTQKSEIENDKVKHG